MNPSRFHSICRLLLGATLLGGPAWPATAGLALVPGRLEIEVKPGVQKTVTFQIESPPSDEVVQGRLMLSLTDWNLSEAGAMEFHDPGTQAMSAVPWVTFSPAAVSVQSGQNYLVRVTLDPPTDLKPGVYRAGIFVQERPPATPPQKGEHNIYFRFRYMEVLYAIVAPAVANPKLVEVGIATSGKGPEIFCKMTNDGSYFVRPHIGWVLRDQSGAVVKREKSHEATVLLPQSTLAERFALADVGPGRYELSVQVDFQDDKPVQAMTRTIDIAP